MDTKNRPANVFLQAVFFILFPAWFLLFMLYWLVAFILHETPRAIRCIWDWSGELVRFWFGDGATGAME